MKERFNLKNLIGKKNLLMTLVALVLVMLMVVGVSYSWIEQISNVEMTLGGEKSPMHISTEKLNKPAESEINNGTAKTIDLSHYFYESGNMHLSSCYSDGKTFYFPKKVHAGSTDIPTYRLGTKDDANVNYISVSFKLKNTEDYEQAYWFDKNSTFFQTKSSADTNLNKLIRMSMTVDGASSIFSASDTPTYKTVDSITASSVSTNNCQSFKAYQYDSTLNNQSDSGNDNYSSTRGANGNTLFVLPAGTTSTITVKVWLEYDNNNRSASLSDINLKLVSSFTKTRKIYLVDNSLYGVNWIVGDSATLWLALDDVDEYKYTNDSNYTNDTYWPITYKDTVNGKKRYEATIPAYLNNQDVYILRCSDQGFGKGDTSKPDQKFKTIGSTNYWAWNRWKTTLPDTYDDRTFTEYTPEFGTWNSKVHHFYFVDSWSWQDNTHLYLWDNATATADTKVIENHAWPGDRMYWASQMSKTSGSTTISNGKIGNTHRIYAVFYDTDYTNVVFNNGDTNNLRQTGDLWIPSDIDDYDYFYDLRSGQWVKDIKYICYKESNANYTYTGSSDDEEFYYSDNSSTVQYATKYLTAGSFYNFQIHNYSNYQKPDGNNWIYKYSYSPDTLVTMGTSYDQSNYICIKESNSSGAKYTGMYTIKYDTTNNKVSIRYPEKVSAGTSGGGSSGSGGSGGSSGDTTEITTTQPTEEGIYLYGRLDNTGSYTQFAKFSSADVNGYVDLNLTKNGTYTIFVWKRQGTTNYQMGQNPEKSITLSSSSNGQEHGFTYGQTNILRLTVNDSGTYRFKINEINGNSYVNLRFYNKDNL